MSQINQLLDIMALLRTPEKGCPWDLEQTFETIAPYAIEEAYEVQDAINQNDTEALKNELGDLLLQVVFHSQIAKELKLFEFDDVVNAISTKMKNRHPHVFGDASIKTSKDQTDSWEKIKEDERNATYRQNDTELISALDGIAVTFPALIRASKLQARAARVGFDWDNIEKVFLKLDEEVKELKEALVSSINEKDRAIKDEMGDLLFTCVNLTRHLGVDAEVTLQESNTKFERRFRNVELLLKKELGISPGDAGLSEMEERWERSKP